MRRRHVIHSVFSNRQQYWPRRRYGWFIRSFRQIWFTKDHHHPLPLMLLLFDHPSRGLLIAYETIAIKIDSWSLTSTGTGGWIDRISSSVRLCSGITLDDFGRETHRDRPSKRSFTTSRALVFIPRWSKAYVASLIDWWDRSRPAIGHLHWSFHRSFGSHRVPLRYRSTTGWQDPREKHDPKTDGGERWLYFFNTRFCQ